MWCGWWNFFVNNICNVLVFFSFFFNRVVVLLNLFCCFKCCFWSLSLVRCVCFFCFESFVYFVVFICFLRVLRSSLFLRVLYLFFRVFRSLFFWEVFFFVLRSMVEILFNSFFCYDVCFCCWRWNSFWMFWEIVKKIKGWILYC